MIIFKKQKQNLQRINSKLAKYPFLHCFLNSKCCSTCSVCYAKKVQPSSSHQLSAFKRFFFFFLFPRSHKFTKELTKCSATPEESELLLRSTCYLPERSHLILFVALAGPLGLSTWIVQQCSRLGFFFCFETEVYLSQRACAYPNSIGS